MSYKLNGKILNWDERIKLYERALKNPEALDEQTKKYLVNDDVFAYGLLDGIERGEDKDGLVTFRFYRWRRFRAEARSANGSSASLGAAPV